MLRIEFGSAFRLWCTWSDNVEVLDLLLGEAGRYRRVFCDME